MLAEPQFSFRKVVDHLIGKRKGSHFFLFLCFLLFLTLCLDLKQTYIGNLVANRQAEENIIAKISFSFPDIAATSLIKQEAIRDISQIYALSSKEIVEYDQEIETKLVELAEWKRIRRDTKFEEVYECKNFLKEELYYLRFTKANMIKKMNEYGFPLEHYIECEAIGTDSIILPQEGWNKVRLKILDAKLFSEEVVDFVVKQFQSKEWSLWEDLQIQHKLRQEVKMRVPLKKTKVKEGSWIIRAGEKVSSRHLDMIKAYREAIKEKENRFSFGSLFGSALMALGLLVPTLMYIYIQQPRVIKSFRKICLLSTIVILSLTIAKVVEYLALNNLWHLNYLFSSPIFVFFGGILCCLLLGMEIAFVTSLFLTAVLGISFVAADRYFLLMNVIASCVGILVVRQIRHRKEIFHMCIKVCASLLFVLCAIHIYEAKIWGLQFFEKAIFIFSSVAVTAIVIVGLLSVLESIFGILTSMTLMEYNNPSNPILRRLSIEAPGTYQHSLNIGDLAESAAIAIGANGLFCKIAALYHDIGKLKNPYYFSENQIRGFNMHLLLSPFESAQIILAHVKDGVQIAEEHELPRSLINIIKEHHGTSIIYHFYNKQGEIEGGLSFIDIKQFQYEGPKPSSKESTIIMIADIVEAAFSASTFEEVNEQVLNEMVDKLVSKKIQEGQLSGSVVSFQELEIIKQIIVQKLLGKNYRRAPLPEFQGPGIGIHSKSFK